MNRYLLFLLLILSGLGACRPAPTVPKPRGYFRTVYPPKMYQDFDSAGFPYTFRYPEYAFISRDSDVIQDAEPYWINVDIPGLNATIYLSYKKVDAANPLDKLIDDSYKMSYAHDVKADYINTPEFHNEHGVSGILYKVGGNAASAYQFYATDNKDNFVRGALYFNAVPNVDSLRPSIDFLKKDLDTIIASLQFR